MKEAVLKLTALFSFCGGPLFVAELLKPRIGTGQGFVITFLPVGMMVIGTLCLEDNRSRWTIAVVRTGLLGLVIVMGMHLYALWCFANGVRIAEQYLYYFGITVGMGWSIFYLRAARRWEASGDDPAQAGDRAAETIEPS